MTTVELRRKQILCMLGVKEEDYSEETLEIIIAIGSIAYNLKEMNNILRINQEAEMEKTDMKKMLNDLLTDTEDIDKFCKHWNVEKKDVYPFMVGVLRSQIRFIANECEFK